MDMNSLSHSKYECKYHIVFAPKFRRRVIYGELRREIGEIIKDLSKRYDVELIEGNACGDHIHILVSIPPKYAISKVIGKIKGKSSLIIFERHANLKYKYGNRNFWCRGYFVTTVGRNEKKIKQYIKEQLHEDMVTDQISMKEYIDPFKGVTK